MMNKMILSNLAHRPLRSLISIVVVALEVTLILLIVGLSLGLVSDSKQRQAGIGGDVIVMPPGSSFVVGLTGAPMSIKIGDILAKLAHVVHVAPVVTQIASTAVWRSSEALISRVTSNWAGHSATSPVGRSKVLSTRSWTTCLP